MKLMFVTDLHGCTWKYRRLYDIARDFQADVVVNSGDMLPKGGDLFQQDRFITNELSQHFKKFDDAGVVYLCFLGNDDLRIFDDLFEETCRRFKYIHNIAQRKAIVENTEFIGMNWVVDYPFRLKDRCRMDTKDYTFQNQFGTGVLSTPAGWLEIDDWHRYAKSLPTIADELELLVRPDDMGRSIYIMHMPPSGLGLDVCGHGQKVGSHAIYNFLHQYQPRLSLHGHIHESPDTSKIWKAALGKTVCIQPGQLSPLTYVTVDLKSMDIERHIEVYK